MVDHVWPAGRPRRRRGGVLADEHQLRPEGKTLSTVAWPRSIQKADPWLVLGTRRDRTYRRTNYQIAQPALWYWQANYRLPHGDLSPRPSLEGRTAADHGPSARLPNAGAG